MYNYVQSIVQYVHMCNTYVRSRKSLVSVYIHPTGDVVKTHLWLPAQGIPRLGLIFAA